MALSACATTLAPAPVTEVIAPAEVAPAVAVESAHARLFRLFKDSDEAQLKLNPISAIFRGDLRYADRFGDGITDAYYDASRVTAQSDLDRLHAINRGELDLTDQLAYDVFEFSTKDTLEGLQPQYLDVSKVRPLNHFFGMQTFYPTFSSGKGGAPFNTVADYDNNLKRHAGYVWWIDQAIARFKQGQAAGVVETKLTIRNVIEQLDNQLSKKPEDSQFYGPIKQFPASFGEADKARLAADYRTMIGGQLFPAITRLRKYLRDDYLASARDGAGLKYMKGGDALYRYNVRSTTTLDMTPEQIHALGLSEVERITEGFENVRKEVGFKGTLPKFFDYMRTAKQFQPKSREQLGDDYRAIGTKVEALLPQYFSTMPKAKLEIRPYDPTIEKFQAGGSYEQGTPDGKRPGTFYYNAYDLPARGTWQETTLFLHEGEPGHHFQISLAQENEALPPFMRFGGNTAYAEGWALYAETLGYDMGFYKDPYQRFGTLNDEMLRAMRLVVDTGIHAQGWTREQAIAYMLGHSGMSRTDATAEVERYIAIPSQATAYKVGALTIQRLRKKAMDELGDKFDIKEFHAQVLMTGALPLAILEKKVDAWIASRRAQ
ncbi:MAG: DUF885 domain-containing protein [Sphingomonas sp.]|nr:DUF885 domain-containing protein [Sphingomonas sp.]